MNEVKVALIGFGGIARAHNGAYKRLRDSGVKVSLVAVCDKNAEQFQRSITINLGTDETPLPEGIHFYTDIDELIEKEDFDMADICLPTCLHKPFAVKLLNAGKHVLCEKPMALSSKDCEEMLEAAKKNDRQLLIGQVLRFDRCYLYLKHCVDTACFGKLKHITMERFSIYPTWGDFSTARSGGLPLDMHIHDIDIVQYLLGRPNKVSSIIHEDVPNCQLIHSRLFYNDATVLVDGAWDVAFEEGFRAGYKARFENASVVCSGNSVKVYPKDEKPFVPELDGEEAMMAEIRHMIDIILNPDLPCINPPESSMMSVQMVEQLRDSANLGGEPICI